LRISIEGSGGHAGGVLMPDRKDALCAAAELILAIENTARASGAPDTVATVGVCDVFPWRGETVFLAAWYSTRHSRYGFGAARSRDAGD